MHTFFSSYPQLDYLIRILAATGCGMLLGLERKHRQETVGIRTLVLISVSSCLLCLISQIMVKAPIGNGDSSRLAAQVVTGIGFIGGGAIIKQGLNIKGLTTAAIIFVACALGLACGIKLYFPAAAVLAISLFILTSFQKFEHKFYPSLKMKTLTITFTALQINENQIRELIVNNGVIIKSIDLETSLSKEKTTISYSIKYPDSLNPVLLVNSLSKLNKVEKISLTE